MTRMYFQTASRSIAPSAFGTSAGPQRAIPCYQFMLVPSQACQAACRYCFGPNSGPAMAHSVLEATVDFISSMVGPTAPVDITFHGGEPLLVGEKWYQAALPLLRNSFGERLRLRIQSNLWALDESFAQLLKSYDVGIGTSLDGPEAINDAQRGAGHFARTMGGIRIARKHGMEVGVVCTFTTLSAPRYREICEFFSGQGLGFSVHAAVAGLAGASLSLDPDTHAQLFSRLFSYYLDHVSRLRISTFDLMAEGLAQGRGQLCTFCHCLGDYFAVAPDGGLYPCNRFVQHPQWRIGDVLSGPSLEELRASEGWLNLVQQQRQAIQTCGDCQHLTYCQGGCPYNAVSANGPVDPACRAYRRVFDEMADEALRQIFSEANLERICQRGLNEHGFLQKGPLLAIMRGGPHPQTVAARAREIAAAAALGCSRDPEDAVARLARAGLVTDSSVALASIVGLTRRLEAQLSGLANLYLHITSACNLACTHCYAGSSGVAGSDCHMSVDEVWRILAEAAAAGFGKLVITGGEPFCHPRLAEILAGLTRSGSQGACVRRVLRTNLALPLPEDLMDLLADAIDEVVVSIDGSPAAHDLRRGPGAHERTLTNLRRLKDAVPRLKLRIASVLLPDQREGAEGRAVRELGASLNIPVRFNPLLPLGRASSLAIPLSPPPVVLDGDVEEAVLQLRPSITCGLGTNLSVTPLAEAYPCHALSTPAHRLANLREVSVAAVLASPRFKQLRRATVDGNLQCARCALRYLCGGFCRAWHAFDHPDAPPRDCTRLHDRARRTLEEALELLHVDANRWVQAGLPLPDRPPVPAEVRQPYFRGSGL